MQVNKHDVQRHKSKARPGQAATVYLEDVPKAVSRACRMARTSLRGFLRVKRR